MEKKTFSNLFLTWITYNYTPVVILKNIRKLYQYLFYIVLVLVNTLVDTDKAQN